MKPTSITRRFASTRDFVNNIVPSPSNYSSYWACKGLWKVSSQELWGSLSCFFAFCKLSENVAEINNMATSVSFRWELERNQKTCLAEKKRRQWKSKKERRRGSGQSVNGTSSTCATPCPPCATPCSALFRMRGFMWHFSDGRRKDTKNKFDWRSRVWKVRRKKLFYLKRLVERLVVKLGAFGNGEASQAREECEQLIKDKKREIEDLLTLKIKIKIKR